MNVAIQTTDQRAIEVVAFGLPPLHHGAQLAVDITLRSALTTTTTTSLPLSRCSPRGWRTLMVRARRDKETKYAELLENDRCHLFVVGMETGRR